MFSIIIPVYNKARFIAGAVQSVRSQTFQEWELIIVDDGSTDDFAAAAEPYESDPKIRIIRKENGGVSTARNVGMLAAEYPYYCFLDADDEWTEDHLECIRDMIARQGGAGLYITGHKSSFNDGRGDDIYAPFAQSGVHRTADLFEYIESLGGKLPFCTITNCVSALAVQEAGMFEPGVRIGEDTDFFLRIALHHDVVLTDHVTAVYHLERSTAVSGQGSLNFVWPFEQRERQIMADPEISPQKKENIRCYLGRFRNHKARHYLMQGRRDLAAAQLEQICDDPRLHRAVMITRCMMLCPAALLRLVYRIKKGRELK